MATSRIVRVTVALLPALAAGASFMAGCAGTGTFVAPPDKFGGSREVSVEGFELRQGCSTVQFKLTVTQGSQVVNTFVGVFNGQARVGNLPGIDFGQRLTIRIEVTAVVGNCDPFVVGAAWEFEGTLTDQGGNRYTVDFSRFRRL